MTTPANLSFDDIMVRVMNSLRLRVDNTTEYAKVAAVVNEVYRDIAAKQDWWWLIKRWSTLTSDNLTGTISVSRGSSGFTLTDTITLVNQYAGDASFQDISGYLMLPQDGTTDVYRVNQMLTPTTGNLMSVYGGIETSLSAHFYPDFLQQDRTLGLHNFPADVGKVLRVTRYGYPVDMDKIGIEQMEQLKSWDHAVGPPQKWSIYDFEATGDPAQTRLLWIYPLPDKNYQCTVWYKQNLNTEMTTGTQPMIPDDYRQILVYGALARCYPIFINDTERGGYYQSLFNDVLALMSAQQREYASDRTGIQPEMRMYRNQNNRRRTAYTLGSWFDRLPFNP